MLAPAAIISPTMTVPPAEFGYGPLDPGMTASRQFKRHKVLPRPHDEKSSISPPRRSHGNDLVIDTSAPPPMDRQRVSSGSLNHQSRRIESGPEPPPTPPIPSQSFKTGQSFLDSPTTPPANDTLPESQDASKPSPSTPPDQRSPPTPDETPPQPIGRPKALRLGAKESMLSSNPSDSRTGSFKTAREDPFSSEDEDGRSTVKASRTPTKTSQSNMRQVYPGHAQRIAQPQELDRALAQMSSATEGQHTPKTRGEFGRFDGTWESSSDVEQEWDENLDRIVTVRKRRRVQESPAAARRETTARPKPKDLMAQAHGDRMARPVSMLEHGEWNISPRRARTRDGSDVGPSTSGTSVSTDTHKSSTTSRKSSASTVVEATVLFDKPPQRTRTLRHVRGQRLLRESMDLSRHRVAAPFAPESPVHVEQTVRQARPRNRREDGRQESIASVTTVNSVSDRRARREVIKAGAIPVIVVPDRSSSTRSKSKEPSLRSTSSRRSKRTASLGSSPIDAPVSRNRDVPPLSNQNHRRGRAYSESDSSETRTVDFPPVIPARSSSLSAPTSRNTSRAGSLTAQSLKALNDMHARDFAQFQPEIESTSPMEPVPPRETATSAAHTSEKIPQIAINPAAEESTRSAAHSIADREQDRLSADHQDDGHSSRRYTARNTPFSLASIETNGTAPEVSEAKAIHMYSHQNSSVMMINHSNKLSESSHATKVNTDAITTNPTITATGPDGGEPVTPPQPQFFLEDVDSPLRNPRAPPEPPTGPPAINFIPATPSGMTPAHDKDVQLGNYFEATGEKPPRRPSLVKRALSRRRHSISHPPPTSREPGFLTRTFSLSRSSNQPASSRRRMGKPDMEGHVTYPQAEDMPAEENKLHPFWRPQWNEEDFRGSFDEPSRDEVYRYPPINNRPRMPKRSLSAKMKSTFAILPQREEYLDASDAAGPERRTIQRTPSGNLRVMRRRTGTDPSTDTGLTDAGRSERPSTAPEGGAQGRYPPRSNDTQRRPQPRRRLSLSDKLEGIQNIPRRLSEARRERRTRELRQKISGPREVRDGVGDVIRSRSFSGPSSQHHGARNAYV